MTLTAEAVAAPPGTSTAASGRTLWQQLKVPLALLLVLVLALVVLGALRSTARGDLDPRSSSPGGGRAIAALLAAGGVEVLVVEDLEQLGGALATGGRTSTVLVPQAGHLFDGELAQIGDRARDAGAALVVGGADDQDLADLDVAATALGLADAQVRDPACELPAAVAAGRALAGGVAYSGAGTGCYPDDGDPTLLVLPGGDLTLLGSVSSLTNDHLDEDGNARLALGLLGERVDGTVTRLLWLVPREDRPRPAEDTRSLGDLVPRGLVWGVVQLFVAALVLALWRGRRLGRVVQEPLPVVVRGAEAVEGRARLYRAAGARGQAAEALRAGARDRLGRALGLPGDAGRAALVETLTARTGADPLRTDALLFGPAPLDDAGLVRLADDLDALHP